MMKASILAVLVVALASATNCKLFKLTKLSEPSLLGLLYQVNSQAAIEITPEVITYHGICSTCVLKSKDEVANPTMCTKMLCKDHKELRKIDTFVLSFLDDVDQVDSNGSVLGFKNSAKDKWVKFESQE